MQHILISFDFSGSNNSQRHFSQQKNSMWFLFFMLSALTVNTVSYPFSQTHLHDEERRTQPIRRYPKSFERLFNTHRKSGIGYDSSAEIQGPPREHTFFNAGPFMYLRPQISISDDPQDNVGMANFLTLFKKYLKERYTSGIGDNGRGSWHQNTNQLESMSKHSTDFTKRARDRTTRQLNCTKNGTCRRDIFRAGGLIIDVLNGKRGTGYYGYYQ